jgi:hypothetical protein
MRSQAASPSSKRLRRPAHMREACDQLLEAHERAARRGKPLLTKDGEVYLRYLLQNGKPPQRRQNNGASNGSRHPLPLWDAVTRRLWLGDRLLKEFRQPAPHQTLLLAVFQEQGWSPAHVDDPISLRDGESPEDAKRRLHETVRNLNRGLPPATIHFRGDGTGQGVIWEYASP